MGLCHTSRSIATVLLDMSTVFTKHLLRDMYRTKFLFHHELTDHFEYGGLDKNIASYLVSEFSLKTFVSGIRILAQKS
jgi:hypothetical protein